MSESSKPEPELRKGYVHISERPSTLDEDEWAIRWVSTEYQENRFGSLLGCSFGLLIVSFITAGIVSYHAGFQYAKIVLAIAGILFVCVVLRYLWQGFRKPSLVEGEPLGTIVTLRFSVQRAWKIDLSAPNTKKLMTYWIMRVAPGVNIMTSVGKANRIELQSGSEFVPGCEVEFDIYVKQWGGLYSSPSGCLAVIRSTGSVEIESSSESTGKAFIPGSILCFDLIGSSGRYYDPSEDGEPVGNYKKYGEIERMTMELEHPVYADLCEVIDERPA